MSVSVQHEDFDLAAETDALAALSREVGAVATFLGYVRADDALTAMTLEHYPGMTEKALQSIVAQAQARWPLLAVRVIHRIGRLLPGERIVFVGVASRHRAAAFEACAYIMDYLKTRAPFWKKEETPAGTRWVDARDSDETALEKWVI